MNKKLLTIEIIQRSQRKTAGGIPKDLAIQVGGLEIPVEVGFLTSFVANDDLDPHRQEHLLVQTLDAGQQIISALSRLAKLSHYESEATSIFKEQRR